MYVLPLGAPRHLVDLHLASMFLPCSKEQADSATRGLSCQHAFGANLRSKVSHNHNLTCPMAGTTSLYGEHEEDMPGKILQIPLICKDLCKKRSRTRSGKSLSEISLGEISGSGLQERSFGNIRASEISVEDLQSL